MKRKIDNINLAAISFFTICISFTLYNGKGFDTCLVFFLSLHFTCCPSSLCVFLSSFFNRRLYFEPCYAVRHSCKGIHEQKTINNVNRFFLCILLSCSIFVGIFFIFYFSSTPLFSLLYITQIVLLFSFSSLFPSLPLWFFLLL